MTNWWFQPTPLKNDGVKVRLDHHPNYWGKINVPNHQPVVCLKSAIFFFLRESSVVENSNSWSHSIQIIQWFRMGHPDEKQHIESPRTEFEYHIHHGNRLKILQHIPYANHGAGIFTYWVICKAHVGIHIPAPWGPHGHHNSRSYGSPLMMCRSFTRLGLMLFMMHTACRTNFTCSLFNAIEMTHQKRG